MKKFIFVFILTLLVTQTAYAISSKEYEELGRLLFGYNVSPSGTYGEVHSDWNNIYPESKHPGVDYPVYLKPIRSVCDGEVTETGGEFGIIAIYNSITDKTYIYMHLSAIDKEIRKGAQVYKGQEIGISGNTSRYKTPHHLHFEVRDKRKTVYASRYSESVDPGFVFKSSSAGLGSTLSTALILDRSGSMIGYKSNAVGRSSNVSDFQKLQKAKEAAKAYIFSRNDSDGVSLSTFSNSGEQVQRMSAVGTIRTNIDQILERINAEGGTNIGAGLEQGYKELGGVTGAGKKLAILMSDGENNQGEWRSKVEKYKQQGWPICAVGFGSDVNENELKEITSDSGCYEFGDISNLDIPYQVINAYASGASTLLQTQDSLSPSGNVSYPFQIASGTEKISTYASWQGSTLRTVLISPDGKKIDSAYVKQGNGKYAEGDTFHMFELNNPAPGKWLINLDWTDPPHEPERINLMVTEKSDVFTRIRGFRPNYSLNEPVTINVDAQELTLGLVKIPLRSPRISIQVRKPGPEMIRLIQAQSSNWTMYKDVMLDVTRDISLVDDGKHNDYRAGDGIFGGTFKETDTNGAYLVTVNLKGQKQNGEPVDKTLLSAFQVGSITENIVTTGQTIDFTNKVQQHIDNKTPYKQDTLRKPVQNIESLQGGDPLDNINKLLNGSK